MTESPPYVSTRSRYRWSPNPLSPYNFDFCISDIVWLDETDTHVPAIASLYTDDSKT